MLYGVVSIRQHGYVCSISWQMARTQKNKATNAHLGLLKSKLAKLRAELIGQQQTKGGAKGDGTFCVDYQSHKVSMFVDQEMPVSGSLDSHQLENQLY